MNLLREPLLRLWKGRSIPGHVLFSRRRLGPLILAFLFLFVQLFFFFPYDANSFLRDLTKTHPQHAICGLEEPSALSCNASSKRSHTIIPNTAHFVYILGNSTGDFAFQFSHYLSMYSAYHFWKPDRIYLHTNVAPDSLPVTRARNGTVGKWSKLIFNLPGLTVNNVTVPTHAGNGKELEGLEHQSDFVRAKVVNEIGGVYIDLDVFALRDIKVLREHGFRTVGGRQTGGELNSGTFMSEPGSTVLQQWTERMNEVYDGGWTTHSNYALTEVGNRIAMEIPCELLILGQNGFAPGSWLPEDVENLFSVHEEEPELQPQPEPQPKLRADAAASSLGEDDIKGNNSTNDWVRDFSCTYLLHSFNPKKARYGVGHNGINPQYVLDRRSNFARAVYPVAKVLLDKGIIDLNDNDIGL